MSAIEGVRKVCCTISAASSYAFAPRYRQLRFQRSVFFGKSGAISIHETK